VAVWVPVAKALRRYGPMVGPIVADRVRRDVQPYWAAYQQARRIDGYLGAWEDSDGKHWVVLDADRSAIAGSFPPMRRDQQQLALDHLDTSGLQHHSETVVAKLGRAPARARDAVPTKARDALLTKLRRTDAPDAGAPDGDA
jgi:hypothetical protein